MNRIQTYSEFWPFYLGEHKNVLNRRLHFIGSSLGIALLISAIILKSGWLVLGAFVVGYAFAWVGHFFIEKNRPATFKYPLWSFISDWRLWYLMLTNRLDVPATKNVAP
jgi:hypothetical protein